MADGRTISGYDGHALSESCTFCRADAAVTLPEASVCATCARRIGRLALELVPEIWAVVQVSSVPPPSSTRGASSAPTFTQMLRAFQRGVAERIGPDDAESHYHLAHAYRAMGLFEDAVRAAGTALDVDAPSTPVAPALAMLLAPPLLRDEGMAALRLRLAVA